ncbi:agmatine deiminase family protein [Roseibium sp.]|uniref:agmatine deiminase family protein n=1 Tax=Roseibium sp. TaxID=1936156 RepID=UPI003BA9BAF5
MPMRRLPLFGAALTGLLAVSVAEAASPRVPAEWEPQAAIWMQWPGRYEKEMRPAFADIIQAVQKHESVHLLANSEKEQQAAASFLVNRGVSVANVTWHIVPIDNAWMRDNGPIYVTDGETLTIQNWAFTGWDGSTGATYHKDDRVPVRLGTLLGMEVADRTDYVLEKGNLEVNGAGIALLNWDCQKQRNPGLGKEEHEQILKEALGLTEIIWSYGHHPDDITTGHIDGSARFINPTTVAIADTGEDTETRLAEDLQTLGFNVEWYPGDVNWLVGDGYVVAMSELDEDLDATLRQELQRYFPAREVHLVDAWSIADGGGGIHCVTNDQPEL